MNKELHLAVKTLIKLSEYHDSVSLMLVAQQLAKQPGVEDAAVVMATEANKGILKQAGLLTPQALAASPNDLVMAVRGAEERLDQALEEAVRRLHQQPCSEPGDEARPRTLRGALKVNPAANLAVISVAGRYATDEAWNALRAGLHVLLFSDNVSLPDEIALKQYAIVNGLLLMGPGAGTAILNGVALGFANKVPAGPVGIVSAAGTGLQEVSSLLAKHGVGISQAIGTGGRDLKEEVGGLMFLAGLKALQDDPATRLIVLVSKPPAPGVAQKVLEQVARSSKPSIVCLLGGEIERLPSPRHEMVATLEQAALLAARLVGSKDSSPKSDYAQAEDQQPEALAARLAPSQRYLRGLFSGGTLCYEAQVIWQDRIREPVLSNAPLYPANQMEDSNRSLLHSVIDLGEEEFTVGRPHPMIDNDLRIRRMLQEARDPATAVLLLDVVIGYGAHPDPAGELGPAIRKARDIAQAEGRYLPVVASVTGTNQDPQCLDRQVKSLEEAGVIVCPSNAAAARLTAAIVNRVKAGKAARPATNQG